MSIPNGDRTIHSNDHFPIFDKRRVSCMNLHTLPKPPPPPVIIATFPSRRPGILSLGYECIKQTIHCDCVLSSCSPELPRLLRCMYCRDVSISIPMRGTTLLCSHGRGPRSRHWLRRAISYHGRGSILWWPYDIFKQQALNIYVYKTAELVRDVKLHASQFEFQR